MKKRILLVSSNPAELHQLSGFMADQGQSCELVCLDTGASALKELAKQPADLILTDFSLADLSGVELLDQTVRQCSSIRTIVLATLEASDTGLKCIGTAHQILGKPCDKEQFKAAVNRAFDADAWLPNDAVRVITRQMTKLPSPPALYFRILKEVQSSLHSLENVGWLIARDPALSAKLLQLANSAAVGLRFKVSNPIEAVVYLGLKKTEALLLMSHTCAFFERIQDFQFSIDRFWQHSARIGDYAQMIAKAEKAEGATRDSSFTAGLLHDIGKLALAANQPNRFSESLRLARTENITELQAEEKVFGTNHAEIGAYLLATWGLPWPILEAVALHHNPARLVKQGFCPLTAVHIANAIDHSATDGGEPKMDSQYLAALGLADHLRIWQGVCKHDKDLGF